MSKTGWFLGIGATLLAGAAAVGGYNYLEMRNEFSYSPSRVMVSKDLDEDGCGPDFVVYDGRGEEHVFLKRKLGEYQSIEEIENGFRNNSERFIDNWKKTIRKNIDSKTKKTSVERLNDPEFNFSDKIKSKLRKYLD